MKRCAQIRSYSSWKIRENIKKDGYELILTHPQRGHLNDDLEQILEGLKLLKESRRKK